MPLDIVINPKAEENYQITLGEARLLATSCQRSSCRQKLWLMYYTGTGQSWDFESIISVWNDAFSEQDLFQLCDNLII